MKWNGSAPTDDQFAVPDDDNPVGSGPLFGGLRVLLACRCSATDDVDSIGCCIWSPDPTGYITLDDRWPDIHARRDFVIEATVVALRPTWLGGVGLKL
jgi:hypothetical protein